jgi:hypothetical protein
MGNCSGVKRRWRTRSTGRSMRDRSQLYSDGGRRSAPRPLTNRARGDFKKQWRAQVAARRVQRNRSLPAST